MDDLKAVQDLIKSVKEKMDVAAKAKPIDQPAIDKYRRALMRLEQAEKQLAFNTDSE